jgi:hypothetical protein
VTHVPTTVGATLRKWADLVTEVLDIEKVGDQIAV